MQIRIFGWLIIVSLTQWSFLKPLVFSACCWYHCSTSWWIHYSGKSNWLKVQNKWIICSWIVRLGMCVCPSFYAVETGFVLSYWCIKRPNEEVPCTISDQLTIGWYTWPTRSALLWHFPLVVDWSINGTVPTSHRIVSFYCASSLCQIGPLLGDEDNKNLQKSDIAYKVCTVPVPRNVIC